MSVFFVDSAITRILPGCANNQLDANGSIKGNIGLLNTVLTWSATSGAALYGNYAINDLWRVALRGEYFDDHNGYLTKNFDANYQGSELKLKKVTLTVGYDPIKSVELRLEGRYDATSPSGLPAVGWGWKRAQRYCCCRSAGRRSKGGEMRGVPRYFR